MNISIALKKSAQLCVSTLMMSIIFLPVQAAENIPVPSKKPMGANIVKYLSSNQSKLYEKIFKAQALGDMKKADALIAKITDSRLIGHVLYQRYVHASYKPKFDELQNWMALYPDYSGAKKIYKLAISLGNTEKITKPRNGRVISQINEPMIYYPKVYISQKPIDSALKRGVARLIRAGKPMEAKKYFDGSNPDNLMDEIGRDIIYSKIAAGFLYSRDFTAAHKLSAQISNRSGKYVPNAAWVAGLALWQQGEFAKSALYFGRAGSSPYASGWLSSAGYYWAARSYKRVGDNENMITALEKASKHSRTFYGIMAQQSLGQNFDFSWKMPKYSPSHERLIFKQPAGKRAISLVTAGQYDLAQDELMRLDYRGNNDLRRAVLAYAAHIGLSEISLRLANMVKNTNGRYYDGALYPLLPWSPEDGYDIDPALIHAIIRQESRFNMQATSHMGAVGLMQIMPKTAAYVANNNNYVGGLTPYKLRLPEINMKIGQDYLEYLLKSRSVKGDVVSMLVSYNAGSGNLLKWQKRMGSNDDKLLFIEMMPVKETRDYVERVLSNYWIYRMRAGLELPSLIALSSGKAPRYAQIIQGDNSYKLALN